MATEYDPRRHTHVTVQDAFFDKPVPVVLVPDKGNRVWVLVTYADVLPSGTVMVGDTLTNGHDQDGTCIASIPADAVGEFLTQDEAECHLVIIEERFPHFAG